MSSSYPTQFTNNVKIVGDVIDPVEVGTTNASLQANTLGVDIIAVINALDVTNNQTVGGTLGVTGATTLNGLTAGATSLSTLSTSGEATLDSVSVAYNQTVGGTLGVTGATTLNGLTAGATTLGATTMTSGTVSGNLTVEGNLILSESISTPNDKVFTASFTAGTSAQINTSSFGLTNTGAFFVMVEQTDGSNSAVFAICIVSGTNAKGNKFASAGTTVLGLQWDHTTGLSLTSTISTTATYDVRIMSASALLV